MLSAYGIDYFKQNFTWFKDKINEYNLYDKDKPISIYNAIMFLEVRNDDWTEEKLYKYIDCLEEMAFRVCYTQRDNMMGTEGNVR